ncbi:MAG: molybdate ABC transporter permease subunit [Bacteroidota bacterium]
MRLCSLMIDLQPIILTLRLALVTTVILFVLSIPLAYKLAFTQSRLKPIFEALVSMPLVLPPTVVGFYLLITFSPNSTIGYWLNNNLGINLAFSFEGLVIASLIYSLPFMVQPLQAGFSKISVNLIEAAKTMGRSNPEILIRVILPNMKPSIITALVLSFAHTIGEFGVVLMIGGNIPGETKVASIAIYDQVEAMNYSAANTYSLILFALSFLILVFVYSINKGSVKSINS